jgi:hypothetical protein
MSALPELSSEQIKPHRVAELIASGAPLDPANDDPFIVPLEETKRAAEAKWKRIGKLLTQMERLQEEIEAEQQALDDLNDLYREQQEAIAHYQEHGGEIPDCLKPKCEDAERAELALASQDERKAAEDELAGLALPAGWEQAGTRTDDQYVYVTLRKERTSNATELRQAFPKRIAKALEPFSRFNAQERKERLQLTVRLGRYTTMPIAANGP